MIQFSYKISLKFIKLMLKYLKKKTRKFNEHLKQTLEIPGGQILNYIIIKLYEIVVG